MGSKIDTYIGFCIKSGKLVRGSGAIDTMRRSDVKLLIMDGTCAKNSRRLALKFCNRFGCPLLICEKGFERIVNRENCRLAAVKDEQLAKAMLACSEENYRLYTGGDIL